MLNVDLVDETVRKLCVCVCDDCCPCCSQGEIRAVAFNEVADKMLTQLEFGQVSTLTASSSHTHTHTHTLQIYFVSRGRLKPANKRFSSVKNDYELSLSEETSVELVGVAMTSSQVVCWSLFRSTVYRRGSGLAHFTV